MTLSTGRAALKQALYIHRKQLGRAARGRSRKPTRWLYPWATERHYAATIRAWFRPLRDYVHSYLKENQEAILRGDSADFTADSADTIAVLHLDAIPGRKFKVMINSLNGWLGQYVPANDESRSGSPLYMGLGNIADTVFDFNEGQFEKGAKSVLGVEFPVGEDWWPDAWDTWASQNYANLSDLMKKYIGQVRDLTEKAVTSGLSVKTLSEQIQALDSKFKKGHANFIARDQIGKLNGEITQRRMESVGLTMYVWETSGDERVRGNPGGLYPSARPSHYAMDGRLCRWSDSTVYSQDGGKTWIPRPSGAVVLHPGMDYQCRCTALSYWQELVDEVDEMIARYEELDTLSAQNVRAMPPRNSTTKAEAQERRRREKNAKKAKEAADRLFPDEKWKPDGEGIYLSPNRAIGKKSNYKDEKRDAQILHLFGSIVYLVPESRKTPGKKYDAIVDGEKFEFKNVTGASILTLRDQFLRSRSQAPNVFINLEKSPLAGNVLKLLN